MRKNTDFPTYRVVYIVVSFLLGLLDMELLYVAIHQLTSLNNGMSMVVALILATAANFMALTWGMGNGKRLEEKSINKRSLGEFLGWVTIGLIYTTIRVVNLINKIGTDDFNLIGDIIQMAILAVSYIGTGTLIQASACEIFDADTSNFRRTKRKFEQAHEDIADADADLREAIGIMMKYDLNYKSLDKQRDKISNSIYKSEKAVMANLVGIMCSENQEISPSMANKVMEEVIEQNKNRQRELSELKNS